MKHSIKITQTLEGHVDIEADSLQAALQKAEDLYEKNGHELPDMDDGARLKFSAEGPKRTPDRANNVKLWLRVGMTLEVTPEMKKQLEAGSIDVLRDILEGNAGHAYLDGETYFPDIEQNAGLEDMEFTFSDGHISVDRQKSLEQEIRNDREDQIPADQYMVNVVRAGEHKIQTAPFNSLRKGDQVFGGNGDICILAEDYSPDDRKENHPGHVRDTFGIVWGPYELERYLQGDIYKVPCMVSKGPDEKIEGTVIVNTYSGDIYNPDFPGVSAHRAADFLDHGDCKLHINGVEAPFYRDKQRNLYSFPSDLRPRPSLKDIMDNASNRTSANAPEKNKPNREPER